MQVVVKGRHMDVDDDLKQYATDKAEKLVRFYDRIQAIEVVFEEEAGTPTAEVIVSAEHKNTFIGRDSGADLYAATDSVVDKLERQLTRHKEKHRNRKHPQ